MFPLYYFVIIVIIPLELEASVPNNSSSNIVERIVFKAMKRCTDEHPFLSIIDAMYIFGDLKFVMNFEKCLVACILEKIKIVGIKIIILFIFKFYFFFRLKELK